MSAAASDYFTDPGAAHPACTTAPVVAGFVVERDLGTCFGVVVRSLGVARGMVAGLQSLVGGEVNQYTQVLEDSRRNAVDRMLENARLLGGNAVVATRFDSSEIGNGLTEVVAYGSAVVLRRAEAAG